MTKKALTAASVTPQIDCFDATALSEFAKRAVARLCDQVEGAKPTGDAMAAIGNPVPAALVYALCDDDEMAANLIVDDLLEAGVSVQEVCIDHLAPAARHLGEWWEKDRLPFTEVTIATSRIQSMLRRIPQCRAASPMISDKGANFVAVPGEEHTLGVMMAADLFRRSGWDVSLIVGHDHAEVMRRLVRDDRQVIGLSCSGDHSFLALKQLLAAIQAERPDARVVLSGQIVHHAKRLAELTQPFETVCDAAEAEAVMQKLEMEVAAATPALKSASR